MLLATQLAPFSYPQPLLVLLQTGVRVPYQLHCCTPLEAEPEELELDELEELELELDELEELELDEPAPAVVPQPDIKLRTNLPDVVSSELDQPPVVLAPGLRIDAPSALSVIDQLAWLILFCLKKSIQALVSASATPPSPSAFTEPHSVANTATPLFSAVRTLLRKLSPCVPA